MNVDLVDRAKQALAQPPDQIAIEYGGRAFDWGWMAKVARDLHEILRRGGVESDDLAGFVPRNRPSAVAALIGQVAAARNLMMAYPYQSPEALGQNVERLNVRALIAAAEDFTPPVVEAARRKGLVGVALDETGGARAVASLDVATSPPCEAEADETSFYILSSGTTGPPKHHRMPYRLMARQVELNQSGTSNPAARNIPALVYSPFANISGMMNVLPPPLNGRKMLLLDRFTVEDWRAYVVRYRPDQGRLPPAAFQMVLEAGVPVEDLASIKWIGTGSSPVDPTVQRNFEAHYGIPLVLAYGATEFAGTVSSMSPALLAEWGDAKFGSVGKPIDGAQIRIVDVETFAPKQAGEVGLVEVLLLPVGPNWIRTSDLGVIDEDGFLYLRGRADGAILRGGFKILPEVVEEALTSHPAVGAACVVARHDERLGQVPVAAVEAVRNRPAPAPEELEDYLRQRLYATQIPVEIRVMEALPRTPSLKINRGAVQSLFAESVGPRDQTR